MNETRPSSTESLKVKFLFLLFRFSRRFMPCLLILLLSDVTKDAHNDCQNYHETDRNDIQLHFFKYVQDPLELVLEDDVHFDTSCVVYS